MLTMSSGPLPTSQLWAGKDVGQTKSLETESLLSAAPQRTRWQRILAALLFVALTAAVLGVVALLWRLTGEIDRLSRIVAQTHLSTGPPISLPAAAPIAGMEYSPPLVDSSRRPCSYNGIESPEDGSCSCYACWQGDDCSTEIDIQQCIVNVESGSPLLFEDYWIDNPAAAVQVPASYHLGYGGQLPALEAAIRALHAKVGNAVTEGRQIVIGMSSTQLQAAAMYALADPSRQPNAPPVKVRATVPYYNAYQALPDYFDSNLFEWAGDETQFEPDQPVMDIITAPNNPDGAMRGKSVQGAFGFYDHAYYWPHFAPIAQAVQYEGRDIACFTLSKLTGHAGSRIGWAIVEDEGIAQLMRQHVFRASGYVQESQLRAVTLLQYVLTTNGSVMSYAMDHMARRWQRLQSIAALSSRLTFQDLEPAQRDNWTGTVRGPAPAYAWLHCNELRDQEDCYQAMADEGIMGRPGPSFGAGPDYNRLELLMQPAVFESLAAKLQLFMTS